MHFEIYSQIHKKSSLTGDVIDSISLQPLPNANVCLANTSIGTTTDKQGHFIIKDLNSGNYTLKIYFVGYKIFSKNIFLKENQNLYIQVKLSDSIITSSPVTIKASRNDDGEWKTGRVNTMNVKNLESLPAQNISTVIDYIPGVNVSNTSGIFSSKTVITMRGLPANDQSRTLVVWDGIVMNKSDMGSVNWNMIDKNNIEEIKVIKGPGPAKYGSGAMGGVIEIISKKNYDKFSGNLGLSYGSLNTLSPNANLSGFIKNKKDIFNWNVSTMARSSDGYITEPDQFIEESDSILVPVYLKEINTAIKGSYIINNKHTIEATYNFFDDRRGTGIKVFEDDGAYSSHLTNKVTLIYSACYGKTKLNTNAYYIAENYKRIYEYMKEGEYSLYMANSERKDKGINVDVSFNKFNKHNISIGTNYKSGSVDGSDTYFTSTDKVLNAGNIDNIAFYIQDEMNFLNENLLLNAGIRYDIAKFYNGMFNIENPSYTLIFYENFQNKNIEAKNWDAICPKFSLRYKFSPEIELYLSAAKGFRAPVLDDMCRSGKKKGGFKVANPDLGPESIYTYELGNDLTFLKFFNLSISAYYSMGKDFMYYTSNGDTVNMGYKLAPVVSMQNIGKVQIYGAETELKCDFAESINCFINYSYTNAKIIKHNVINVAVDSNLTGKHLTDIPEHKVSAGISWKNKIINISLLYKYIGKIWINDYNSVDTEYLLTDRYPAYDIYSLRFSKNLFKKFELALDIENLFNKIFIDADVQKNPGRFITASVKYKF